MATMNAEELAVWQRVTSYSFDTPGAVRSFAGRLADEHGSSLKFAKRAIDEYRRFVFLAVASGHSVTPSEVVDEVWHLHLLHSHAYWNDFCPNVLGQSFHHFPSTGTVADNSKHNDWYTKTLDSYRKFFGSEPGDIWPTPEKRQRTRVTPRHVDAERVWILPKPRFLQQWRWITTAALLFVLTGCAGQTPWPFSMPGPQFLGLLGSLMGGLFLVTALIAFKIRSGDQPDEPLPELTDEETAWLTGKAPRVLGTVITRLTRDGYLQVDPVGKRLSAGKPLPLDAAELDREIVDQIQAGRNLLRIAQEIRPATAPIRERLIKLGLLVSDEANWWGRVIPAALALILIGVGVAKLCVGVQLHRPVGFLIQMIGVLTVFLIAMCLPAHGTWLGNSIRRKLTREHYQLKRHYSQSSDATCLPLAMALFGPAVLYKTDLEDLRQQLNPHGHAHTSGCSTSGGGCGGGCGGGGCGGCGGG